MQISAAARAALLADEAAVHGGPHVEMFSGTVILVPGERPHVILTPRFCKSPRDQERNPADNMERLIRTAVIDSAMDIAREARRHLKLPEVVETAYGPIPLEESDARAAAQPPANGRAG